MPLWRMPSDRKVRKLIRQWRRRYPYPVDWVGDTPNKACRKSEEEWLARFEGASVLRRRDVRSLVEWRFSGQATACEAALLGIDGPAAWGHAQRRVKKALKTSSTTGALDLLLGECGGVPGWGPEMASAVLAACRPRVYAVADPRSLQALRALKRVEPRQTEEFLRTDWWPYLRSCRQLSLLCGQSLRAVQQALWAAGDAAAAPPGPRRRA